MFKFFGQVNQEMHKVHWPDVHQTKIDTETVVGTSVAFAIFFAAIDGLLQWALAFI